MWYRTVFAFFYFVFEGNFQVKAPGGLFSKGQFNEGFFLRYEFGGLIFRGACTRMGLFSEFYLHKCMMGIFTFFASYTF